MENLASNLASNLAGNLNMEGEEALVGKYFFWIETIDIYHFCQKIDFKASNDDKMKKMMYSS